MREKGQSGAKRGGTPGTVKVVRGGVWRAERDRHCFRLSYSESLPVWESGGGHSRTQVKAIYALCFLGRDTRPPQPCDKAAHGGSRLPGRRGSLAAHEASFLPFMAAFRDV